MTDSRLITKDLSDKLILLVDNDIELIRLLTPHLEGTFGCQVQSYFELQEAHEAITGGLIYNLLLVDQEFNSGDGLRLAKQSKEANPNIPVVVLSGYQNLKCEHADLILKKPTSFYREPIRSHIITLLTKGKL